MGKILFGAKVSEKHLIKTREVAPDWNIVISENPEEKIKEIKDAEVYVDWGFNFERQLVEAAERLKWIQSLSAGVERLPFDLVKEKGIIVTNTSGIHKVPISELVFGYMLMFARGLNRFYEQQKNKIWNKKVNTTELFEKTLGIVGTGNIGSEIARLGKAFGMKVIGLRRSGRIKGDYDEMYGSSSLKELLSKSDFVVCAVPLTVETRHLFREEHFRAMKPTAYFINIARGAVVDESALIKALKEGWIAGAALDVFEEEPLPPESPLWGMPNVIITPHIAGSSDRYMERAMKVVNENLERYLKNERLINVVDLDRGY
ncbi:D-2-hydroxyacid dehydrogenase [Thermosediminibacter oceani]|uniref:D-isomer specific 2-hydroxyacid dehydrogenase NAD-binding protein n=1 Tax=Thermosediminibacter oceani (strain ATCC BAA-1034 / DSM 16646 / JW/IW-1228P) TaxID=555079 RepID=D9RYU0_THEOJ|nr:D-2-hydroxyacid dehydrogenase [Thermosediminibacter oceani]ADL08514.1 D-isomer specific 2-hydroxyacid dehydrogenase NAD-binding protein [Thermosediminibacter oceani DSM 16646]